MKKIMVSLFALTLSAYAQDAVQAPVKVKVAGDRVSLRAAPEGTAVLLARAVTGDELILRDNSHPDWVGVLPPENIDLWVNCEFVSNNTVQAELLNIRSGPSLSHSVVGTVHKGDRLTVRGEIAQWLKIAPTSNTIIWISRKYVSVMVPAVPAVQAAAEAVKETVTVPETQTVAQAAAPSVEDVMDAASAAVQKKLTPDPARPQGVEGAYSGVLQPVDALLCKLTDDHFTDITVCYVRGNRDQMKTCSGRHLRITGKTYWAKGLDLPLIVPATIEILETVPKN